MNEENLLKYAVHYLSKYDSSKKNLSDILKKKVFRLNITDFEKNKLINFIKNIIIKLEKNNLINDDRYCFSKISSLSRIGKSKNFIFNYLIKKGLDRFEIKKNFRIFEVILIGN